MRISCNSCPAIYNVPEERIPAKGAKTKCKKCGAVIIVQPLQHRQVTASEIPQEQLRNQSSASAPKEENQEKGISANQKVASVAADKAGGSTDSMKPAREMISEKVDLNAAKGAGDKAIDAAIALKNKSSDEFNALPRENQLALVITASLVGVSAVLLPLSSHALVGFTLKLIVLVFLALMLVGCIKGWKREFVVFYDKKDVFYSFMILGSIFATVLPLLFIDAVLFDSAVFESTIGKIILALITISAMTYFLYKAVYLSILYNRGKSNLILTYAICSKLGAGIIYPLVLFASYSSISEQSTAMKNANNLGDYLDARSKRNTNTLIFAIIAVVGGWIVYKLVNGDEVLERRGQAETREAQMA